MGCQGQLNHFNHYAKEKIPYGIKRYHDETLRLMDVIEAQLEGRWSGQKKEYLAGKGKGKYSWADICAYPWAILADYSGITKEEMDSLPNLKAWTDRIGERPAVKIACGKKYDNGMDELAIGKGLFK